MAALSLIVFDVNETLLDLQNTGGDFRAHLWREDGHQLQLREVSLVEDFLIDDIVADRFAIVRPPGLRPTRMVLSQA